MRSLIKDEPASVAPARPAIVIAYAFRSGHIGFADAQLGVPEGALHLCAGPKKRVEETVAGLARRGYDGTLFVPGCPEAADEGEAFEAFITFAERLKLALARKPSRSKCNPHQGAPECARRRRNRT